MVTVENRNLDELTRRIEELDALDNKPGNLTKKESDRRTSLLGIISALKGGSTPGEIRRWEIDRILREAGLPKEPEPARIGLGEPIEAEWRSFMRGEAVRPTRIPNDREVRANEAGQQSISFTQPTAGGTFVPEGFFRRLMGTAKQYDQIFDDKYATIVETDTGSALPCPIFDDTTNSAVQVGETTQSAEVDIANFGTVTLNAYSFRTKIVAISIELLQDSSFPWGAVMEKVFAGRIARGVGAALINGSGVGTPTGLLTGVVASGASPVIAAGASTNDGGSETGATSIGTQDLASCYAKLDAAYRVGAAWYMADSTLTTLQGLLDKMGHPIVKFRQGLTDIGFETPFIFGKPVAICPSMPSIGSGHNAVLFGNPAFFITRRVPSASYVRRFWQTASLVQYGLVGFEAWMRTDSNLIAPNVNQLPYQFIQNHS